MTFPNRTIGTMNKVDLSLITFSPFLHPFHSLKQEIVGSIINVRIGTMCLGPGAHPPHHTEYPEFHKMKASVDIKKSQNSFLNFFRLYV